MTSSLSSQEVLRVPHDQDSSDDEALQAELERDLDDWPVCSRGQRLHTMTEAPCYAFQMLATVLFLRSDLPLFCSWASVFHIIAQWVRPPTACLAVVFCSRLSAPTHGLHGSGVAADRRASPDGSSWRGGAPPNAAAPAGEGCDLWVAHKSGHLIVGCHKSQPALSCTPPNDMCSIHARGAAHDLQLESPGGVACSLPPSHPALFYRG